MDPISLLLIGGMVLVFWLLILRPQTRQANQAKEFQQSLEKGARVVTTGGIHGKVLKVEENGVVLLEIDNNTKVRIEKTGISMEMSKAAYGKEEKKTDTPEAKK